MYSPKIKAELIAELYRIGKALSKPMTQVVDSMVREGIRRWNRGKERSKSHENNTVHNPTSPERSVGI